MSQTVCFGSFELDPRTGELRKKGRRIRLAPQPASLLSLLANRPGQLVTREEIRRHLWGGGVFVEYERSLNACVAHLRSILGDRAHAPRYIETSPRRGYRFVAAVQQRRPFPQPTIAVLPFANLTGDPSNEYFAAGLTDALITELASISSLRVISHQSVLHLKGSSRTLPEIASELGADALLEGSAVCEGDRVRVHVQLVAVSPERHLWAKAYECARGEVITVHRQVARAVADSVDAALTPSEIERLSGASRIDPAAQDAYVKGCFHATQWSEEHAGAALACFEEAIARDPGYAPAHAALARTLWVLAYWGYLPLTPTLTRAKRAAEAAVACDEALASAHAVLAMLRWFLDWDLEAFVRGTDRAISLSPSDPQAHSQAAFFHVSVPSGRDRAFAEAELTLRLDPLSESAHFLVAWVYLFGGDVPRALEAARKTLDLFPDSVQALWALGLSLLATGRGQEAVVSLEKAARLSREPVALGYLGTAYALTGRPDAARQLLEELFARRARGFVPWKPFIVLHAALGEIDRALDALDEAYRARDPILFHIHAASLTPFAPLRGHPRFQALLDRLPTYAFRR